jgi:hypothetical protein
LAVRDNRKKTVEKYKDIRIETYKNIDIERYMKCIIKSNVY